MKTSIIIYLDKIESLKKCLAPIVKSGAQIILIDPVSDESSMSEYEQFKNSIEVINAMNVGMSEGYNLGLKKAEGDFINFSLSSSFLSPNAVSAVQKAAKKKDDYGEKASLITVDVSGINTLNDMNTPVNYKMQSHEKGFANIRVETNKINCVLQSYFIRRTMLKDMRFNTELLSSAIDEFLLRLIEKITIVYNIKSAKYVYTSLLESSANACETARNKDWYTFAMKKFFIPETLRLEKQNGTVPTYLQIYMLYLVYAKFNNNYFDRDREALDRREAFEFNDVVSEWLCHINNNIIFQNVPCRYTMPRFLKMHFYRYKCKKLGLKPLDVKVIEGGYFNNQLVLNDEIYRSYTPQMIEAIEERNDALDLCTMGLIENQKAKVKIIDKIGENLEMDLAFDSYLLDCSDYEFYAAIIDGENEEKLELIPTEVYSFNKYFNITIDRQKTYHLTVPIKALKGKKLCFIVKLGGKKYYQIISFMKVYSHLCNSSMSYFMLGKKEYLSNTPTSMSVGSMNPAKHFIFEILLFILRLFRTPVAFSLRVKYLFVRFAYWVLYPFYHKKRIWITFDKLYKAGDDGEYMFQYCRGLDDNIDIYYIISPDAPDYQRLKAQHGKYVIKQDSLKIKLLSLYAEVILATHATVFNYMGYTPKTQVFVKDLFKAVIVCIQHGLTIQKIAQYQNRVFDNTRLYTLASKYEKENVSSPIYDFFGKELKLTGLARYDGLKSNDQKQILITPTWRRNIVNQSIAFIKKTHNDSFKNSEYYRIYNSLINDKTLIECAKKTGYKIIYLLHPAMSSQADDFDTNDYVQLMQATGDMSYEKILTESSLMVTDYSGVQFDFAYQRKPLVYYHPESLPPHYESGGLIYETMGFGPICKNHNELISTLCDYMMNDCKMREEYIARADDFFEFDDFNSCERIYNEVIKFMADENNF